MASVALTFPAIIVLLGTLIFFHELGHFVTAKLLGMKVQEFGFGLPIGRRLARLFKRGETEYTIYPVPLGGFVKLAGMEPGEEHVPDGFQSKPWWSRMLVHLAGPVASLMLAYIIFCGIGLALGIPTGDTNDVINRVDLVMPGSEADRIGLKSGDIIISLNGKEITSGKQILNIVHSSSFKQLDIRVRRDDRVFDVKGTPRPQEVALSKLGITVATTWDAKRSNRILKVAAKSDAQKAGFQVGDVLTTIDGEKVTSAERLIALADENANRRAVFGLKRDDQKVEIAAVLKPGEVRADKLVGLLGFLPAQRLVRVGVAESFEYGTRVTTAFVTTTVKLLFSREVKDAVGGPIAIADATLQSVKRGWNGYLELMGVLSLSLAIVNILPIPVVDGGQIVLLLVEAVRRRRLSAKTWEISARIGWTMIAILFALIMYLDLSRVVANKLFR